ncbi:mitochondrial deoxynucleotide carrier protein [Catenaria anguillulae PL171]|uniref:Mitochondrial deoxynucleotide carrier protein n=1 Tax=Catenaria anguillulae PL171 TaxID=765915 RepID=A0A1Y2HJK0_9FUNG|nr:mitochondrial deoxynucleotide carrier protein [Catenaria anguillulae PL171]
MECRSTLYIPVSASTVDRPPPKFKLSPTQNALCGGFAGMTARMVISPIDVVKIRLQLQPHHPTPSMRMYPSFWSACLRIARDEGPLAFWKGNLPAELLYLCYGAVQFWTYSVACAYLGDTSGSKFIAGGVAGGVATAASYPFDLLRTRFAMQPSGKDKVYSSLAGAVRQIYASEGIRGFYLGVGPSILQIFPYMSLTFGTYELLLPMYRSIPALPSGSDAVVCGALAGACAKFGVYPLDTIRKRVQVQGPARAQYVVAAPKYVDRTWWRVGALIVQREGVRALYRGLVPGIAKAGPSSAVTFWAFEVARGWCERWEAARRKV